MVSEVTGVYSLKYCMKCVFGNPSVSREHGAKAGAAGPLCCSGGWQAATAHAGDWLLGQPQRRHEGSGCTGIRPWDVLAVPSMGAQPVP